MMCDLISRIRGRVRGDIIYSVINPARVPKLLVFLEKLIEQRLSAIAKRLSHQNNTENDYLLLFIVNNVHITNSRRYINNYK